MPRRSPTSCSVNSGAGSDRLGACLSMLREPQTGPWDAAVIPVVALGIWLYLFFAHGRFWQSGPELLPALPSETPDVDIIIPARGEAETIGPVIASLLDQQ